MLRLFQEPIIGVFIRYNYSYIFMYNYIRKKSLIEGKFQETRKIAETCLISLKYPPVQFEMASRAPEWEIIG